MRQFREITLSPEETELHDAHQKTSATVYRMAVECLNSGDRNRCEALCRQAISYDAGNADALHLLGGLLFQSGDISISHDLIERAVALRPNSAEFHTSLGYILKQQGNFAIAIQRYRHALSLDPEYAVAHHYLGHLGLLLGDFDTGWRETEWRDRFEAGKQMVNAAAFSQPGWNGDEFLGKTLHVQAEQGLGDTLQFVRYMPYIKARGGRVVFHCPQQLMGLLAGFDGVDDLRPKLDGAMDGVSFDMKVKLLSVPGLLGTRLETIPAHVPYLRADQEDQTRWRERLVAGQRHIGTAWAGSPTPYDRFRSCPLAAFFPLVQMPHVTVHSLQYGTGARQLDDVAWGGEIVNWGDEIRDFESMAALIANLDLVISVDTVVAHLAGGMGMPVWTLLPYVPDSRWLLERDDSPWYPTMRLFRQKVPGRWDDVLGIVAMKLHDERHVARGE